MPYKPPALKISMEAAAPTHVDWRYRPMFGGIGVYANDRMCVSLSDIGLAVKLAGPPYDALLKLKGAKPLQYEPGAPVSKTYVVVPPAMLADAKTLGHWLGICADQAAAAPAKKPRKSAEKSVIAHRKPRRA